jgi:hypothetical protein
MKAPTIPWRGAPRDHDGQDPDTREDTMAKGQMRSNREKKKPKADKSKKKGTPAVSPFSAVRLTGNPNQGGGKKF